MHGTPTLPSNGKTLPFVVFMVCPNQRGFLYDVSGKILNPSSHVVLLQGYQVTWPVATYGTPLHNQKIPIYYNYTPTNKIP